MIRPTDESPPADSPSDLFGGVPAPSDAVGSQGTPDPAPREPSFEQLMERLETIVRRLEEEQPALDDSLRLFEEGMSLARQGEQLLQGAEARVEKIVAAQADGSVRVEPLDAPE